jgi:hypothetical protein
MRACCSWLADNVDRKCATHTRAGDCPDALIVRTPSGFGLSIKDGGESWIEILFCPWCGTRFRRDDPHTHGKARLGWRYWPTVYFYAVWNGIVAAWRRLREDTW